MTITTARIQRTKLTGDKRFGALNQRYRVAAGMFQNYLFALAARYSPDYNGGFWDYFELSNGGFYASLAIDKSSLRVENPDNHFEGEMSPDAFSIGVNLCALSHLTFDQYPSSLVDDICRDYDRLREYMFVHEEVKKLVRFTD